MTWNERKVAALLMAAIWKERHAINCSALQHIPGERQTALITKAVRPT